MQQSFVVTAIDKYLTISLYNENVKGNITFAFKRSLSNILEEGAGRTVKQSIGRNFEITFRNYSNISFAIKTPFKSNHIASKVLS